jgi:hypothetical protein
MSVTKAKKKAKSDYEYRDGYRASVPADVAGRELERISKRHGGELRPEEVVEESREPEAPLHPVFEWDDERAAELHRQEQARGLIRSVRVVYQDADDQPSQRIAYISVRTDPDSDRSYVSATRVMEEPELKNQAIADAISLLRGVQRRYRELTELEAVWEAIDDVCQTSSV